MFWMFLAMFTTFFLVKSYWHLYQNHWRQQLKIFSVLLPSLIHPFGSFLLSRLPLFPPLLAFWNLLSALVNLVVNCLKDKSTLHFKSERTVFHISWESCSVITLILKSFKQVLFCLFEIGFFYSQAWFVTNKTLKTYFLTSFLTKHILNE